MANLILPDRDYLLQCFVYDAESGAVTWRVRPAQHFEGNGRDASWLAACWNAKWAGKRAGKEFRFSRITYRRIGLCKKQYLEHRIVWKMITGNEVGSIDHRDADGTNNRWSNLRPATRAQNSSNARQWLKKALPKGVRARASGFEARITANKTVFHLGLFNTPEEAAAAYREAADRLHGEFANYGQG